MEKTAMGIKEQARLFAESKMMDNWDRQDHVLIGVFYHYFVEYIINHASQFKQPVPDETEGINIDKQKIFLSVLKTLKNNKVMVDTRGDGIYIRLAGKESLGEAFTLHFGLVYPFYAQLNDNKNQQPLPTPPSK